MGPRASPTRTTRYAIISGRSKLSEWDSIYKKWRDQGGAKAADELVKEFESTH